MSASREAVGLALAYADEDDELADEILAGHGMTTVEQVELCAALAALVLWNRGDPEAFADELYDVALEQARR